MEHETNLFLAAAKALWNKGEDAEVIAKELAIAFREITLEAGVDHLSEYKKFTKVK